MKKLILGLALLGSFTACQKEDAAPAAEPGFTFRATTADALDIATHDTCSLFNKSKNAQSFSWDFGNGVTSQAKRPVLSYDKPGNYIVTLTTTNGAGQKSSVSKTVRVLDVVVQRVIVNSAYWSLTPIPNFNATWPQTEQADVFVQIQHVTENSKFLPGGIVENAPVVFRSESLKNVVRDTRTPLTIAVPGKVVLDKRKFGRSFSSDYYLISLMATDATGTYCLVSNMFSGGNALAKVDDFASRKYVYAVSLLSSLEVECSYE
ncbi:PKD domain-containing protein [Hymenobacter cellulosivorans]|uniref:PKD domain-containing protein n=1 Tax=Hymenobacter cellulosivorans TaxID=2932249 RepID=A0ABY4FBD5_9BACT|nr:PKD domain-containing protein [Hymenobacter cellulosivorans]UOQ53979.1 PKD domain-containing protein [Hymenobacter cellulosivorans]